MAVAKKKKEVVLDEVEVQDEVVEKSETPAKEPAKKKFDIKSFLQNKTLIALLVIIVFVGGGYAFVKYFGQKDIGPDAAKTKVEKYINENLVQAGTKATVKNIVANGNLYKVTLTVGTQEVIGYVTKDGKLFFPQAYEMDKTSAEKSASKAASNEKTTAETKADVPTVDLFVMSYCPYGLQMERGVLPAVESLGNKIKFNLKFVSYTLHGQKEVDENTNQYCIAKTQPAKLNAYLKCFWQKSTGTADACMTSTGINAQQVKTCVADAKTQFNPTEKDYSIDKADNTKYGVEGSPTLVVNGTTVSSGRDSASVLKAICSGFKTQPKECSATLPATSPVAGFDDEAAASSASGGTAASGGSCN
ncbi:MAG: hypothetical protein WCI63_03825 [bacterium]